MERLLRHHYPGNVRELENLIKRLIVLGDPFLRNGGDGAAVAAASRLAAPLPAGPEISLREASRKASLAAEREIIAKTLEQCGGNRVRAAKMLRISYRALLYKIKRVGLARIRPSFSPTSFSPTMPERPDVGEPWTS
jgi:two-component system response regulator AtoC